MFIQVYSTDSKDFIIRYKNFDDTLTEREEMAKFIIQESFYENVNKIVIKKYEGNKPESN